MTSNTDNARWSELSLRPRTTRPTPAAAAMEMLDMIHDLAMRSEQDGAIAIWAKVNALGNDLRETVFTHVGDSSTQLNAAA